MVGPIDLNQAQNTSIEHPKVLVEVCDRYWGRKFGTRYSGHLVSRLMQNVTQHGQTTRFGFCMVKACVNAGQ
jgi:hypothetical protein